jgi:predicted molibdopterin-dependent oxidoreductase YjgC
VVIADDLEETHNVASVRVKDAAVREGAKVIVIGSLRSELVDFAAAWIRPDAGDEGRAAAELADALGGKASKDPDVNAAASLLKDADRERTIVICAPNPVSPAIASAMAGGAANIATALFEKDASAHLLVMPPAVNANGLADLGIGAAAPESGAVLAIRDDLTMRGLEAGTAAVAIDSVLSETAKAAGVVLAEGRAYASRGTYLQGDFRAQRLEPAITPEGDARPLYDILAALAKALDVDAPTTAEALAAIARELPTYQPAADLLVGDGVKLEIAPTGQAKSVPVSAVKASGDGLRIVACRDLYTERDAAALHHPEAEKLHRYDRIQVSEIDAERLKLKTGDEIELTAGKHTLRAPVTVTERVAPGSVFVSSLLQGGAIAAFFEGDSIPTAKLGALTPA